MRPRGRCCTSCAARWSRRSVSCSRGSEIDEFFLGGYEEGLKGGRQRGKKTLCGAAIEVRGRGSGRLRLEVLANSRATTLEEFTKTTTAPGTTVHTDGLFSYSALPKLGYDHRSPQGRKRPRRRAPAA